MEAALVLASAELGLADDDVVSRERLACFIFALYRAGQTDVERLKIYAISRFNFASAFIPQGLVFVTSKPTPPPEQSD